ncbi:uncharacterized protein LOC109725875 [Ananas comosus]|uniref:Uncharacterized protein LOC109725875 n=1 Tax=Ananas comosus TaxID=4615 RepID=A0A6P5GSR0_ANACO|nr:uncharacterized protein LOC109725875 [Ananas comosus]
MQWYWTITRRWISTPVQQPPLAYQPRGHVERVVVDIVQRSHYTIRHVLSDIPGGGVLDALSHIADQMEAVLETLPTFSHTVSPRPTDYGRASTSGHALVYSPLRPSSPIEEPPYADVMDPAPAPVPQDPPRAVDIVYYRRRRHMQSNHTDQPISSAPSRPDILPTPATAVIEPVIEGAAIEHLDQLEILESFDEHGVDRGRGRSRRRGLGSRRRT